MNLDQQIRVLIDNAPQDGRTPQIVQAIAPVLTYLAGQLQHTQYYIVQTINQDWLLTTLSNRSQPEVEKHVIYAFPTLNDAKNAPSYPPDTQAITLPVPVTHILFQMVAMDVVDSIVFFETPGNLTAGTEVQRKDLQNLIQLQLQQDRPTPPTKPRNVPPNIA